MKKQITFLMTMLLVALFSTQMQAQKEVLYLNNANSQQEEGTSVPGDDPITKMLNADANFNVTPGTIDGSGNILPVDLSPYDLIIIQEDVSSGSNAFKSFSDGPLALRNLTVPVIYCKSEAFRNDKATLTTAAGIHSNKSEISVTVPLANQTDDLFSGIDFNGGTDLNLFHETADGNGTAGTTGLKVLNNLEIGNGTVGGTLATTADVVDAATSVIINYIPSGTQLGTTATDVATVDIAIFGFSYGIQVRGDGTNITSEALTIWRNTAYKLTGQVVPSTLYVNTSELSKVLYLNNANSQQEEGTSVPGDDPITRMLNADANFMVSTGTIDGSGNILPVDLSPYDLIIIQEDVSSGSNAFKSFSDGPLALRNLTVPVIYCKSEAFRNDKATLTTAAGIHSNKSETAVTVPLANQSDDLFTGIDFNGGTDLNLFYRTANGNGTPGTTGLKVLNNLEIGNGTVGGTLATTADVVDAATSVIINYIPSGTQLGTTATDVATVDIAIFGFSYGVQVRGDGTNITSETLTIWRNTAYKLTGKTIPSTLYVNDKEPKQILYVNQIGVGQGAGASAPGQDPVISMLDADDTFFVTYVETPSDGSAVPDLSGFDLVIAQETISSGAAMFQPGGVLGVKDVTIPIIYNKSWAFRNGKAITDADAAVTGTQNVSVTATNTAHFLFNGIDFSGGDDIRIFKSASANDDGSAGGNKAIDVLNDLEISNAGAGTIATVPEVTDAAKAFVINWLPSGTQLGEAATDVLTVNAVALSFSYGATILGDGANITPEALTIWRNAVHALIFGIAEVPTTLVENSNYTAPKKLLYVNQLGVGQGAGASAPGADPVINMFYADTNFDVTYVETASDGSGLPALAGFDLVIAQETISSGAAMFQPGGVLGVKDVTVPIIYNKSWAFRDGKAVTDADAAVTGTQNVSVTATNTAHPLFYGIDFSASDDIRIFKEATANDDGSTGGNKGIDVLNNLEISNAGAGTLALVNEVSDAAKSFVINYIPSGTQLGEAATDVLAVNAVALSFSYGAMIMGDGANISPEALTIWRNAAYMLAYGITEVPSTLVENANFVLAIDKVGEVSNVTSNLRSFENRIYVSNVKSATEVNIYSFTGALVKSFTTNEDIDFEFERGAWIATIKTYDGVKAVKFVTK